MENLKFLFIAIIIVTCSLSITAQWSVDPTINTEICTAINKQTEVDICSNGQGGAYMVWRDYRDNSGIFEGDIYAQQIDFSGNMLWAIDGIVINNAANGQFRPKIVSDDNGGAIIVWAKNGGGFYGYDLYAQHIDINGDLLWNSDGVEVAVTNATDSFHEIIPDGEGGVIIVWQRLPTVPGQTDIYAQKVNANGEVQWNTDGVAVCTTAENQSNPKLVSDENGGAIIVWEDSRVGTGYLDIYAQRIDFDGNAVWTTDGVSICSDSSTQTLPEICTDGSSGAIVVWEDYRTGSSAVYGQRINPDGQVQWITDGKFLSPLSTTCTKPNLIYENSGSVYFVWEIEMQIMETNIGSQKIDLDGNPLWGTSGVDICVASGYQVEVSIMKTIAGGIIVSWQDLRNNSQGDIYAQSVDRNGNLKWTPNGVEISGASDVQSYPVLTTDGLAGAIITWWDLRNGTDENIYVQNIDYRGELGTTNFYYQKQNLNKPISDVSPTSDTLTVPAIAKVTSQTVFDITIMIGNVLHDNVSDLEFTLTHGGISDTLIYQVNGNGGVNFTNTYLNDNLGISFDVASAPFAGIFIPYNSLTNFTSTSLPGEWILTITDHKSGDDGVLQDWGLLISESTIVGIEEKNDFLIPNSISLFQNYPNPFNPCTIISYQLAVSSKVILKVYDILGNEVATLVNEEKPAGNYKIEFEATNLSSGLYFYQLKSGEFVQTKKMILIK